MEIGDKVVCKRNYGVDGKYDLVIGKKYSILDITTARMDKNKIMIRVDSTSWLYNVDLFSLLKLERKRKLNEIENKNRN